MQVLHNYNRKSVKGVSILTTWLDVCACSSGLMQTQVDSWIDDYGLFFYDPRLNLGKVLLVVISISFDLNIIT